MNSLDNLYSHRRLANTPVIKILFEILKKNKFYRFWCQLYRKIIPITFHCLDAFFSSYNVTLVFGRLRAIYSKFTCGLSSGSPNNGLFGTYPISASTATPSSTHDIYIVAPPSQLPIVSATYLFDQSFYYNKLFLL